MDVLLGVLEAAPDGTARRRSTGSASWSSARRAAGLPVTLEVTGKRRPLGAGAGLTVYRVVQEALTNAIKHAGGATTDVRLAWGEDALRAWPTAATAGPARGSRARATGCSGCVSGCACYGGEVDERAAAGGGLRSPRRCRASPTRPRCPERPEV